MVNEAAAHGIEELDEDALRIMISRYVAPERVPKRIRMFTDTSDFFRIEYDDVVLFDDTPYLIRTNEREGRFGIDDQPKFWVKRAIDLTNGAAKVIKMVFHEEFSANVGGITFDCVRSPKKEARVLDLVRGHPHFMQGFSVSDSAGNIIRIIDFIPGKTFADYACSLGDRHEEYFQDHFPGVFMQYLELVRAIRFLHIHGEKHGDIRRDHIIRASSDGVCRWIDFDFNYWHKENKFGYDLFGLGNILVYLVGRGDVTVQHLKQTGSPVLDRLKAGDVNIIFNNRVANLKKVYPYIPDSLNMVLLHFSLGAEVFYDDVEQLLSDLEEVREIIELPENQRRNP